MTMILIGLGAGGCSVSRTDGGAPFAKGPVAKGPVAKGPVANGPFAKADDGDLTGSITAQAKDPLPTDSDLAFARNAASDVLSQGDKDSSQHWENPETGARGSVTPIAQAYAAEDGRKCRDFLASYVNGRTESWLQGAGCQSGHGRWEIHTLKPWRS